ncbi:MAG: ATP-binding cassette domain-containing protein [Prevotellaceae bacterium]|jgi:ABC-2 type transport system ATP-binding protein|nr:ATP-binding cassette domain-containing protein [Prevotellaceae bacterium]
MNVLLINNISKNYSTVRALNNVSFTVPEKCTFGILGPNGSGKTTLLGIVTEVLMPTSGSFTLFDDNSMPKNEIRKKMGTMLETPNFYHYLSAERNLQISARIKGIDESEIDKVLKQVGLYERKLSKFNTFSLGMKQRLAIAAALLGSPKVLILDEPTNGLDPEGIAEIRGLIKQLGAEGHTIIMASHLLDEVEKVCTHVAILKSGNLLTAGRTDEVLANEDIVEVSAKDVDKLFVILKEAYSGLKITRDGNTVLLHFISNNIDTELINRYCFEHGVVPNKLLLKKKSLESMFLELVSNPVNRE